MPGSRDFAYVQARLQARHGERLDAAGWRSLEAARSLGLHLERARATALRRHAERLGATMTSHGLEAVLRREAEQCVAEVAGWMPARWRPATAWIAVLPSLPLLEGVLAGAALPDWAAEDRRLAPLVGVEPGMRAAICTTLPIAPLADVRAGGDVATRWLGHWRRLWPKGAGRDPRLADFVAAVAQAFGAPRPAEAAWSDTTARDRLERVLVRHFRRTAASPVAAFAHLGLVFLDLERFRGGLVRRALFEGPTEEEAA